MKNRVCKVVYTFLCLVTSVSLGYAQTNLFPPSGNVGIGTTSPTAPLNIQRGTATSQYPSVTSLGNVMQKLDYGDNSIELGVAAASNSRRMWILARHKNYTSYGKYYGTLHLQPDIGDKSNFRGIGIGYTVGTAVSIGTHLAVNGKVGIGVSAPTEMLEVNGTIKTKEVNVTATGWPDYVFRSGYQLMPLSELEAFIQKNGHLPDVPTEAEVMENGVNLAEMNVKLLEKVEELTLYVLELQRKSEEQDELIRKLIKQNQNEK
ncbi:hypothetical protein LZF95_21030 [Algoriphagus sp. AGSA1]|uniref:hypothetical protein n=1 Tax=Algoriphagus sp. AGSA1 TaxID=2907213 RepID=UPI001F3AD765|nr:hypothetical protein [Algoriphagus sp. AGSA1]MCE7057178.1 hypothetical protein [Algoriphagus sp. AGSA1]